jgi:hypothetical protein
MKPCIRLCLLLILSIALPVTGMAQVLMTAGSSSMGHANHLVTAGDMASMSVADTEHECCAQHEQGDPTVCKTGQECKTSSLLKVISMETPSVVPGQHLSAPYIDLIPSLAPDAVWHPPRI